MTEDERRALSALRFNWAPVPDDVWRDSPYHVAGLHQTIEQTVLDGLDDARLSEDASPIGLVLQGQRGAGKTHLLGWVREQVHARGGYFFLVSLLDAKGFWGSVAGSLTEGLFRTVDGRESQLRTLMRGLGTAVGAPRTVRRAVAGETALSRPLLDAFIAHLGARDVLVGRECQETARALALLASDSPHLREIGETFLQSVDDDHGERPDWGMRRSPRPAELVVRDLSWLLALTGPTIIAVDQIDTLIAQSVKTLRGGGEDAGRDLLLEQIAGGLMSLRERTRRTLTLVACLPTSWHLIKLRATDSVQDRFREATHLKTIPTAEIGRELVERRFSVQFGKIGFDPTYPTWPVRPGAFADAPGFTPRQLLIEIDRHVRSCEADGEVRPLDGLGRPPVVEPSTPVISPPEVPQRDLLPLDARFAELTALVDVAAPFDEGTEDAVVPALLSAGFTAWIVERGADGRAFTHDPPPGAKPALHGRLRRTLDESIEDQVHWGFRGIASTHPIAALTRLRKASTAAGLTEGIPKRKLFVLRNGDWSNGPKTRAALATFTACGGRTIPLMEEDIRILGALSTLLAENPANLHAWLVARQPASRVGIFRASVGAVGDRDDQSAAVMGGAGEPGDNQDGKERAAEERAAEERAGEERAADERAGEERAGEERAGAGRLPPAAVPGHRLTVGFGFEDGGEVQVEIEALRKHVAIFAGSGSGKTVLIRRLVEECAIRGVSAIVLDPNNDLARLGDPWPQAPPGWGADDPGRAADYLANTEVMVWTPRRQSGRPLSFQPLPDFRAVLDDADEFAEAVEAAVASIAPRAKLDGKTSKAHLGQAVLRKAVQYHARHGGTRLKGLIELLSALPDGVSELDNAEKIAADLAQILTAAVDNDPLFGGEGTPVDPSVLLTPSPGKRARVSVISFVGLPSDEQRQSFVNQLQMALFAWIKRNPAGDRPLGGLLVMDEAQTLAPSGAMTACTHSTLALASQARKYGLGLIFATQAPKGLHNRIPGNAATQFFGLMNAPIQITAAKEMAAAKGGEVPDISRLGSGQFYVAVEGAAFAKIRAPHCLSHHPRSPLTTQEVIQRAGEVGTE